MKALAFLICALLTVLCIRAIDGQEPPMLIDGAMVAQAAAGKRCESAQPYPAVPVTAAPNSTYLTTVAPPQRFTGGAKVKVEFVSPDEANRICANQASGLPVCGRLFYACHRDGKLIMPNPCGYPMSDPYAKLFCHEQAHVNGWPASHGD